MNGQPIDIPSPDAEFVQWTFHADGGLTYATVSGGLRDHSYRVDVRTDPPSICLDLAPARAGGWVGLGFWKVSGDTLTMAVAPEGTARPTAFQSESGSRVHLAVFKRVKARE